MAPEAETQKSSMKKVTTSVDAAEAKKSKSAKVTLNLTASNDGSDSKNSMKRNSVQRNSYVITETYHTIDPCYVELGSTKTGFDEAAVPEGVPFEMVIDHIDREIRLKTSCKSLPYTLLFYLCVVWSAWLKCDTYTYGVGSSVEELFDEIEINHDQVHALFQKKDQNGGRVDSVLNYVGAKRRLKAAGKGGGDKDDGSGGVTSPATLWAFFHQGVVPLLWYEGNGRVRRYHKIIGGVRIRQIRAAVQECQSGTLRKWYGEMGDEIRACRSWAEASSDWFGVNRSDDVAFRPYGIIGEETVYELWLPTTASKKQIQDRLMDLWKGGWVDYRTKRVRMEVGMYNGDVDSFAFTRYEYNFGSDGAVRHIPRIMTTNNQFRKWYYFAADVCVFILILGLIVTEFIEIYKAVKAGELCERYFHGTEFMWNMCDWASMFLGNLTLGGYIWLDGVRLAVVDSVVDSSKTDVDGTHWSQTVDKLADLCELKKKHEVIIYFFLLCIMIRFFKAFRGQPRLAILTTTFAKCCQEVMYFFVIFLVIFSNFVVTGFLLFNSQIASWSTLSKSINECFEILMGEFEFDEMKNVHPFAASLWFWSFMILVLLITLSMLLAVILETYSIVKVEQAEESADGMFTQLYYLVLQSRWYRFLARCCASKENKIESSWLRIEKVYDDLIMMEGAQRLTMLKNPQLIGQHIVLRVTRDSFKKIGLPESQVHFFWKVFRKYLEKQKERIEEQKVLRDAAPNQDGAPEAEDEVPDVELEMTKMVDRLEGKMAANEAAIRVGFREILMKMATLDGKSHGLDS